MGTSHYADKFVRSYLLGEIDDPDVRSCFEDACRGNHDLWDLLENVWSSLTYTYAEGRLSANERNRVEHIDHHLGRNDLSRAVTIIQLIDTLKVDEMSDQEPAGRPAKVDANEHNRLLYQALRKYVLGLLEQEMAAAITEQARSDEELREMISEERIALATEYARGLLTGAELFAFDLLRNTDTAMHALVDRILVGPSLLNIP